MYVVTRCEMQQDKWRLGKCRRKPECSSFAHLLIMCNRVYNFLECVCVGVLYVGLNVSAVCWIIPVLPHMYKFLGSPVFIYSFVFVPILTVQTCDSSKKKKRQPTLWHLCLWLVSKLVWHHLIPTHFLTYCHNTAGIISGHLQNHLACLDNLCLSSHSDMSGDAVSSFELRTIFIAHLKAANCGIISVRHLKATPADYL